MPQPENVRHGYIEEDQEDDCTLDLDIYEAEDAVRVISCRNNEWVPDSEDIHSYRKQEGDWENQYDHGFGFSENSGKLLEDI